MTVINDLEKELESLRGVSVILFSLGNQLNEGELTNMPDSLYSLSYWTNEIADRIQASLDASFDDKNPIETYLVKKKDSFKGHIYEHRDRIEPDVDDQPDSIH